MNVVTHLLVGWTLAEHTTKSPRDRALITAASDGPGQGTTVTIQLPISRLQPAMAMVSAA